MGKRNKDMNKTSGEHYWEGFEYGLKQAMDSVRESCMSFSCNKECMPLEVKSLLRAKILKDLKDELKGKFT